ncbi:DUF3168 domain-containing protein [Brucella intermedia]|uniref:DUF3168 domain-containing protein n=1 Tax=Brucella intermedia TaxID=94625 RepID=UPI001879CD63|nr:DUF3168 domain-containing protein [Brucella intermedia]
MIALAKRQFVKVGPAEWQGAAMLEPTLALQTAVRTALVNSADLTGIVPANSIRSGSTRPDKLPSVILSGVATQMTEYRGFMSQARAAQCLLDIHVWALDDGIDTAWQIGFAVCNALMNAPATDSFVIDEWEKPSVRWMRDPDPEKSLCHGVVSLSAIVRWKV